MAMWICEKGGHCVDSCEGCEHYVEMVEVKRGRWTWDERFHDYTCSECHNWDLKTPNFCSNCGADMRSEGNNENQ